MARLFFQNDLDWTTALFTADTACTRRAACSGGMPTGTASSRSCAPQSSMATADYNSMQLTLRKRWSDGYQFDVNYTLSKSTDLGSAVERGTSRASAATPASC